METTRLKYNLVFINPTWLLDVQMNNIILRGSHSLKYMEYCIYMMFGGVLGRPLDTFFWALTIPWSRLLAHVGGGPKYHWMVYLDFFHRVTKRKL